MKFYALAAAILLPCTLFASTPAQRHPSGVIVVQSPLHLALSPTEQTNPQWNCGECRGKIRLSGSKGDSLVDHLAPLGPVFESMINGATHHDAYKLRFKLYF